MSRPDTKDIFAPKPGIFSWLRDQAYDFVYYEIGTGLDFVGDMFRGPSGYSKSLHRQAGKAQARASEMKPLTKAEQAVFAGMLERKPFEGQVAYWKRKKALLGNSNKQDLVAQQRALDVAMERQASKAQPNIIIEPPSLTQNLTRTKTAQQTKMRRRR